MKGIFVGSSIALAVLFISFFSSSNHSTNREARQSIASRFFSELQLQSAHAARPPRPRRPRRPTSDIRRLCRRQPALCEQRCERRMAYCDGFFARRLAFEQSRSPFAGRRWPVPAECLDYLTNSGMRDPNTGALLNPPKPLCQNQSCARDFGLAFPASDKGKCDLCPVGVAMDACGECGGNGEKCKGCDGVPNSGKVVDVCGLCGGNGESCLGCDGKPNSGAMLDLCGVCGGDGTSCADKCDVAIVAAGSKDFRGAFTNTEQCKVTPIPEPTETPQPKETPEATPVPPDPILSPIATAQATFGILQ